MTPKQEQKLIKQILNFKQKLTSLLAAADQGKKIKGELKWLTIQDIAEYIEYCNAFLNGEYKKAYELQENMDSSVRDMLPNSIYNELEKHCGVVGKAVLSE